VDGIPVQVASREALLRMKRASGRAVDLEDVRWLENHPYFTAQLEGVSAGVPFCIAWRTQDSITSGIHSSCASVASSAECVCTGAVA
jgi:hypothetical protein